MTTTISIATAAKPRTPRTAKGLILSGAQGKRARRDGRHETFEKAPTRRPVPVVYYDVLHSLHSDVDGFDYDVFGDTRFNRLGSRVWTSESSAFKVGPAKPRPIKRTEQRRLYQYKEAKLPTHDEAGRPIVYKTDDVWDHRCGH